MSNRDGIVIGLLGVGTIGSSVMRIIGERQRIISERLGCPIYIKKALVRDLDRSRDVDMSRLTTSVADILDDPEINVVIEVLGGENPAHEYIARAIARGKYVVTANKEVMAKHGLELLHQARENGVDIYFEASVGGGIPLIGPFRQDLAANEIVSIKAIINGTTNYILTRMAQSGTEFGAALRQAQELGYAEPDPTNDIQATDAAYKLAILATLAFRVPVRPPDVYREGIDRLHPRDFQYARELGYAIKLLAIAKRIGDGVEVRVHPAFLPNDFLLAQVNDVYNGVHVEGDLVGKVLFYGQGAGPAPTSSAIVADVIDLAQDLQKGVANRSVFKPNSALALLPMEAVRTRYYLRLQVADRPGVLAQIAKICGDNDISIASVIQKEVSDLAPFAEIVIMTHAAREDHMRAALVAMRLSSSVKEIGNFIRVEGND
ncbi:MAG: homoserine dehydrogenase [Chloroflexi bacterium]|nr:homoserine dehydrogenase [Chloroflexota bacterium]